MAGLSIRLYPALIASLALSGCGPQTSSRTLLDAAALYQENQAVFASIRAAYPGPYEDFARIPARDPADDTGLDRDFLQSLRENFPVERIDFFPIGDTGADEIDVVLERYQAGDQWRTISLIYFSTPLTLSKKDPAMRLFETCDEASLDWLEARPEGEDSAVFCRLNANWYAYQRVE